MVQRGAEMKLPNKIIIKAVSRKKLAPLFLSLYIDVPPQRAKRFCGMANYRNKFVGDGVLDVPFGEWQCLDYHKFVQDNIVRIIQMRLQTKRANTVRPYII